MKVSIKTSVAESNDNLNGEWVRLPKPGDRFYGMSRTTLYELCERGHIRSRVIKKRGAIRGIRLIFLPSLIKYLHFGATGGEES